MRLTAAVVAVVALALLNLAQLIGTGYAGFATRRLDRSPTPGSLAAARVASELSPWSSPNAALLGWIHAENRAAEPALAAYARALRLAPADGVLWAEYAQALGRLGRFDATMAHATRRAQTLAPHSAAVVRALAGVGLGYWTRGDDALHAAWIESMRAELQRNRGGFLGDVLARGQGGIFCRGPAEILRESAWCERIAPAMVEGCYRLDPVEPAPCETP